MLIDGMFTIEEFAQDHKKILEGFERYVIDDNRDE
jgi:hypothetical protein